MGADYVEYADGKFASVVHDTGLTPFAYESVTVADAAIGLSAGIYSNATRAEMTLETAPIRRRSDGTDPTITEGRLVGIGDTIVLTSAAQIMGFEAIRTTSTSGVLKVEYLR